MRAVDQRGYFTFRSTAMLLALAFLSGCSTMAEPRLSAQRAALKAQADAWDAAIIAKDAVGVARNMHPQFQQIASDGSRHDRQQFIDSILSPKLEIDPYTVDDFDIDIQGDVALLRGHTRMTGRYDGKPFVTEYEYLDVYLYTEGRWQVRHVQTTPVGL